MLAVKEKAAGEEAELSAAGASLVAISPQLPEHNRELVRTRQLTFDILTDRGNEVARKFGLRFNVQNATFIRIDVGFSHEGFQVWFKFNDVFNSRRYGTTTGQPVY